MVSDRSSGFEIALSEFYPKIAINRDRQNPFVGIVRPTNPACHRLGFRGGVGRLQGIVRCRRVAIFRVSVGFLTRKAG